MALAKKSLIPLSVSFVLFSACASVETRYINIPCEVQRPTRPHIADFANEFEFLKAVFNYTFEIEKELTKCQ